MLGHHHPSCLRRVLNPVPQSEACPSPGVGGGPAQLPSLLGTSTWPRHPLPQPPPSLQLPGGCDWPTAPPPPRSLVHTPQAGVESADLAPRVAWAGPLHLRLLPRLALRRVPLAPGGSRPCGLRHRPGAHGWQRLPGAAVPVPYKVTPSMRAVLGVSVYTASLESPGSVGGSPALWGEAGRVREATAASGEPGRGARPASAWTCRVGLVWLLSSRASAHPLRGFGLSRANFCGCAPLLPGPSVGLWLLRGRSGRLSPCGWWSGLLGTPSFSGLGSALSPALSRDSGGAGLRVGPTTTAEGLFFVPVRAVWSWEPGATWAEGLVRPSLWGGPRGYTCTSPQGYCEAGGRWTGTGEPRVRPRPSWEPAGRTLVTPRSSHCLATTGKGGRDTSLDKSWPLAPPGVGPSALGPV